MKKISSIKSFFQLFYVWIISTVKTVKSGLPAFEQQPAVLCGRSPEGQRVLLVRAVSNFELKKRGEAK
jgi:hypothetical protein